MQDLLPRGPFRNQKELVLASASPRRQELLQRLGIHFLVRPSESAEPSWLEWNSSPEEFVAAAAREKAREAIKHLGEEAVLAADTVIALDREILGKAGDDAQALDMLKRLSGRSHRVLTGCFIAADRGRLKEEFSVATQVDMPVFDEDTLRAYVQTGEYEGKAGAYAIQGVGAFLVEGIRGSYTNVVGLPLQEVLSSLLRMEAVRACWESTQ